MHNSHSHAHNAPFVGHVINHSWLYSLVFTPFLRRSEGRITELAHIKLGDTVLDVGCGPGSLTRTAQKRAGQTGQAYGIDASEPMIKTATRQAKESGSGAIFQVGLAQALPYEDGKFDVVVSRLAFHHLPGELKAEAFAEIYRVLKPGGYCLIVDFDDKEQKIPALFRRSKPREMLDTDVLTYRPLMEKSGFTNFEIGATGYRFLSFIRGQR